MYPFYRGKGANVNLKNFRCCSKIKENYDEERLV
jgi:hypothetical protein